MYVSLKDIGNALSGGKGWDAKEGNAANFTLGGLNYYAYKPDRSLAPGSGGLLLSTMIQEKVTDQPENEGSLMLTFDAEARLVSAQFDYYRKSNEHIGGSTGVVKGSTPAAIGAEIQRLTPADSTYFHMGRAGNHAVVALAQGVYKSCKIISALTGKALSVVEGSTATGALIDQWDFIGVDNQLWRLVPLGPFRYLIVSVKSGKALSNPNSGSEGTQMNQWDYNGTPNQQWTCTPFGFDDMFVVKNDYSKLVLSIKDWSTSNGAPIVQANLVGPPHSAWRFHGV